MSLNESPDCQIEKIINADETEVIALVATYLENEQMQYFLRNQDCLTTDLHSTKARLGINQEKLSSFELIVFSSDDKKITCPQCNHSRVKRVLSSTCFIGTSGGGGCDTHASKGFS